MYRAKVDYYGTNSSAWSTDKAQMTYLSSSYLRVLTTDKTVDEVNQLLDAGDFGDLLWRPLGLVPQTWNTLLNIFPDFRYINLFWKMAPKYIGPGAANPSRLMENFQVQEMSPGMFGGYSYVYAFPHSPATSGGILRLAKHSEWGDSYVADKLDNGSVWAVSATWLDLIEPNFIFRGGANDFDWGTNTWGDKLITHTWSMYPYVGIPCIFAGGVNGVISIIGGSGEEAGSAYLHIRANTGGPRQNAYMNAYIYTEGTVDPFNPDNDPSMYTQPTSSEEVSTHDITSNDTGFPTLPSISATALGLASVFEPTLQEISDLSSFLWGANFVDTVKKAFSSPMDAIISLSICPFTPSTESTATALNVGLVPSGISMHRVSSQLQVVDCGMLHLKPAYAGALAYEPYTKVSVYLPYIGIRDISADDVMDKDVYIKYYVDLLSGGCTAMLVVPAPSDPAVFQTIYQWSGNLFTQVPISARDFSNFWSATVMAATTAVTAGAGAAAAGAGAAATAAKDSLVANTGGIVSSAKPHIPRASGVGNAAGLMGRQKPYFIVEWPKQSLAKDFPKFAGYPSNVTAQLSSLGGFTAIESIHLQGFGCTQAEQTEILRLLQQGVIL